MTSGGGGGGGGGGGVVVMDVEYPPQKEKSVLLFWAPWHEESVRLKNTVMPALSASSSEALLFGCVEAEKQPALSKRYGVTVVPTFCLLDGSDKIFDKMEGIVEIAQVTQAVQRLIHAPTTLEDRLKKLIGDSPVMLFMKGSPDAPRCGFSRQTVELLQKANIPFGSFDILTDDEVRQGLKTFSDWPTYPQLYVRGELIGGLDILKEMQQEDSSLAEQLQVESLEERLGKLVRRNRIMLFMKGSPSAPRCGFSRKMVELLEKEGADFDSFDILEDEQVRQGLKKYSDWPTYPQLYIDGDLIGGLDICKEMVDSGDFIELIQAS